MDLRSSLRMRILHTAATYFPLLDGIAQVLHHISEGLVRRGHQVHVATAAVSSRPPYTIINGVHVRSFVARGNLALGMSGEIGKYSDFVRAGDWDIAVNHCLQAWPTDAILNELGWYPWPSVLVTHGLSAVGSPDFRDYYRRVDCA